MRDAGVHVERCEQGKEGVRRALRLSLYVATLEEDEGSAAE